MAERTRRRRKIEAPFPGLRPFLSGENLIFFGREGQSNELIDRLRENHFLAVLGSSGSGKSSLVRAGLQPDLEAGLMAGVQPNWKVAIMRPGDRPLLNLAEALVDLLPAELRSPDALIPPITMLMTMLQASSFGLKEAALGPILSPDENLVVIADQFEEIFRFNEENPDPVKLDEAKAFVRLLLEASSDPNVPIYVVITMRSDFLGECPRFTGLAEAINKGQYLVPRLSRAQMREAITGPVAVFNATIAPDLVIRILNDIGDNADQLPILQHALMRTWEQHCEGEEISMADYEAIGGLSNALNQHAEEIYDELNRKGLGGVTEALFKSLTQLEGDGKGIRRPTRLTEVVEVTGAMPAQVIEVVEAFRKPGRTFLMPPYEVPIQPDTILDISHESFMRLWHRLGGWVREETQSAEEYLRLSRAAREYAQGKVNLWRQPELGIALKWQENIRPTAAWAARYDDNFDKALLFLGQSHEAWLKEEDDKAAIAMMQRNDEERRKTLRRQTVLLILMGGMLSIVTAALLFAWYQNGIAKERTDEAEAARRVVEGQKEELEKNKTLLDSQVVYINVLNNTLQRVNDSLIHSSKTIDEQRQMLATQVAMVSERNRRLEAIRNQLDSQNEKLGLTNQSLESQRRKADSLADLANSERNEARSKSVILQALQWADRSQEAPDKETAGLLARKAFDAFDSLGADVNDPRIYTALQGALERLKPQILHSFPVAPMVFRFDPSCEKGYVLGLTGELYEYFQSSGTPASALKSNLGAHDVRLLAFGKENKTLLMSDMKHRFMVYRALSGQELHALEGHSHPITGAVEIPSQNMLVTCDLSGLVNRWNLAFPDPKPLSLVTDRGSSYTAMAVDPSGRAMVLGKNGVIELVDVERMIEVKEFRVEGKVTAMAFNPSSTVLVYGLDNGKVGVINLSNGTSQVYQTHKSRVTQIQFSPDGQFIASSSYDQTLCLAPSSSLGQRPTVLKGHTDWVVGFGFSADSRMLYSVSKDKTVRQWFTDSRELVLTLEKLSGRENFTPTEQKQYDLPDGNIKIRSPKR